MTTRRAGALARDAGVDPAIARLLCLRGITDAEAAHRFLHPSLDHLHDPMRLADMGAAVERLLTAVASGERIAVHGDYDVDGITATVILRRALELLGGDVVHFVPDRMRDGYGLNTPAIERLHAEGARVIVSVDCGIRGGGGGPPRAGTRRRSHHHRPPRAGRRAAAGARRGQSRSAGTAPIPTRTSRASAWR